MLAECGRKLSNDLLGLSPRTRSLGQRDHLARAQNRLHRGTGPATCYHAEASHGRPRDALSPEYPAETQTRIIGGHRGRSESAGNKVQRERQSYKTNNHSRRAGLAHHP